MQVAERDGRPLRRPDGRDPEFAADGIARSSDGRYLYWQAVKGDTLYRIPTEVRDNQGFRGEDVSGFVEPYGLNGPADGLLIARGTDKLLITAIQEDAVKIRDVGDGPGAVPRVLVQDPRLRWPDTFAQGPDGSVDVTTSRIQDSAWFKPDGRRRCLPSCGG